MNEETPGRHYARKDTVGAIFRDYIVLAVPQTTKKKSDCPFLRARTGAHLFLLERSPTPRPLPSFFPFTFPAHFRVIILH